MVLAIIGVGFLVWFALVLLFTPRIDYQVTEALPPDGGQFLHVLQSTCQTVLHPGNRVELLVNGQRFYPAVREAMAAARSSIHLEAYIFKPGEVASGLIDVMTERARAGVDVRIVLDAIGSARLGSTVERQLRDAGCQLQFYQPIRWYRLHRLNNRTHRELIVIDGRVAFAGGAGVADWWYRTTPASLMHRLVAALRLRRMADDPPWRDSMVRIDGPVVAGLQGVFAENWLECCGEILSSPAQWPALADAGPVEAMVVRSSPADRATTSRTMFQMLLDGANSHVNITTPYFLPDRAFRRSLIRAVARGVTVRVVVPGATTDQRLVRLASRRMYGRLLEGGLEIYEYRPAMIHAKTLLVDGSWAVVGTTNIDNRSFEHNDEINVAFRHSEIVERMRQQFEVDVRESDLVTLHEWKRRPLLEKLVEPVCWILERQQ